MGSEAMKPLLRHTLGQHDLKTVVRSNFRPEIAEKQATQFLERLDSPNCRYLFYSLLKVLEGCVQWLLYFQTIARS